MSDLIDGIYNSVKESIPNIPLQFITEIVNNIKPAFDKYIKINDLHVKYINGDITTTEHKLEDTIMIIDIEELEITDEYAIIPLYIEPGNIKGLFYILDTDSIDDAIHDIITIFILMKCGGCVPGHDFIQKIHPVVIASIICFAEMVNYKINDDTLIFMMSQISPNVISMIGCLPLSMILTMRSK